MKQNKLFYLKIVKYANRFIKKFNLKKLKINKAYFIY